MEELKKKVFKEKKLKYPTITQSEKGIKIWGVHVMLMVAFGTQTFAWISLNRERHQGFYLLSII